MLDITGRLLKTINKPHQAQRKPRPLNTVRKTNRVTKRRVQQKEINPVPVMVRGDVAGLSTPMYRRKKVRRHYDLALNVPGAEMRLPALPQIQFGWRLVSGLMVVSLSILLYYLWTLPTFQVSEAQVLGLSRLSIRDVNTVLNINNQPIFALDADKLKQKITNAFPEFAKVDVKLGLPNVVQVDVVERLPLLKWHQEGRTVLVDANGFSFPERALEESGPAITVEASSAPPAVPVAEIKEGSMQYLSVDMVSAILSISAQVPQGATLIYDSQHGLGWRESRGWAVYFGDARDIDMKLNVYKAILKKLKKEGITPALISVEYVHAPYYRLEQ